MTWPDTPETLFRDRLHQHLAWCVQNEVLSEDRAREILGVSVVTMREIVAEWSTEAWFDKNFEPRTCVVCERVLP